MAKQNSNEPTIYWIDDFVGMIQRQNTDKIPLNASPLLKNISLDKPGSWIKRKGSDLLASTQAGAGVYGLIEYVPYASTPKLRAIRTRDLDTYDTGTDLYTEIDNDQFTAATKVQSNNFLNRVYHVSTADYLCYESGGTCTDVGAGGNEIRGNSIAVAQNTLFVGGVTYIGTTGAVSQQDRVYYSFFNNSGNTPSHQLYDNETGSNTMATSTRWFTVLSPVKALFSFGNTNLVYVFTSNECYSFDMGLENNAVGPKKVFDIGIASADAVCQINGWMIWMSPDCRLWAYNGYSTPQPISWDLEDEANAQSVISTIDKTKIDEIALGALGNIFTVSIGDVSYHGTSVSNAVLVGLMTQNLSNILWSLWSFPVKPYKFTVATFSGTKSLVFGALGVDDVYRLNTGTNDGSTAVSSFARTRFIDHGTPLNTHEASQVLIKFRPQSADSTYLRVGYAIDGNEVYTYITDPDGGTSITEYGKIDMYESDYSTNQDKLMMVNMPGSVKYRSISIEVANVQAGESFEVSGIGIVYRTLPILDLTFDMDV